jgi:hypothetical protein
MSEPKRALVLHLVSGGDPLLIAINPEAAEPLADRLPALMRSGDFETITAANDSVVTVNFAQVVAAHVDVVTGLTGQLYGAPSRSGGFSH